MSGRASAIEMALAARDHLDSAGSPKAQHADLIYAAVSICFDRVEELEEVLPEKSFARLPPLPWEAAFSADSDRLERAHDASASSVRSACSNTNPS